VNVNVFESARAAIVSHLKTYLDSAHPSLVVQYDNRDVVNVETQTEPYLCCEVTFMDGEAGSIGSEPLGRYYGAVWLSINVKQGDGSAEALTLLGELAGLFKSQMLANLVYTGVPRPLPGRPGAGWWVSSLRVPFRIQRPMMRMPLA
jgi:hypothetical protein